jgi:hypothetical protein
VERLLTDMEALADEVLFTWTEPEPITDRHGRVWVWWKGDLYRHEHSVLPLALLRKICE